MSIRPVFVPTLALLAVLFAVGCQRNGTAKLDIAQAEMLKGYISADIVTAEHALLAHKRELLQMEAKRELQNVSRNFLLALVHARLSYLYSVAGKTNEADLHLAEATNFMALRAREQNREIPLLSREQVYKEVEMSDRNLDVKWKPKDSKPAGEKP